jgi:transposase
MNTIVVGVLSPGEEMPVVDRIFNDEESIRRLIGRFADRRVLSACYEAGPGGDELSPASVMGPAVCHDLGTTGSGQ